MRIDYKKELETASKGMIMIHDPKLLIKLIIRMIVRKLGVKHAAMILYDPDKSAYILNISRGQVGFKIPPGFTRFNRESPIIKFFMEDPYKKLIVGRNAIVQEDINKFIWREGVIRNDKGSGTVELLRKIDDQMQMLNTLACVPAYYQDRLLAVLLLGEKYDNSKFDQEELDFFSALASDAAMAIRNAQLFNHLRLEAERNKRQFLQTIIVLGSTIEAKDKYTHGHTERVTNYSLAIAHQMEKNGTMRFPESFFDNLYIAGLLHDIGKIGVPENILNKTGKLTDDEYEIMKGHTIRGVEIVKPLELAQETLDGIKHHHERFDGKGYPDRLKGNQIPITAAIIAVADTYDAMTSDRSYRKGLKKTKAIEEIKNNIGIQFNPLPAKAMIELFKKGEV
ncbi:MAG: HD domain-containing protein [Candidatus Omnitrophica bacterium]|nr:HD domain-containing protein [Candidatus Omnitrophota bacterium]